MKRFLFFFLFLIFLATSSASVLALSLAPVDTELTFTPGATKTIKFQVMDNQPGKIEFYAKGDPHIASLVKIEPKTVDLEPGKWAYTTAKITMPQEMEEDIAKIKIGFGPASSEGSDGTFAFNFGLEGTINIVKYYDEPHAISRIDYMPRGKNFDFMVVAKNNGNSKIESASAKIYVEGPGITDALVYYTNIDSVNLKKEVPLTATANLNDFISGMHTVQAELQYDGIEAEYKPMANIMIPGKKGRKIQAKPPEPKKSFLDRFKKKEPKQESAPVQAPDATDSLSLQPKKPKLLTTAMLIRIIAGMLIIITIILIILKIKGGRKQ